MLNDNIREFRKGKNLTQEQLAEAMGVSTASVSKWETGQSAPELGMLAELADFFEVSVDALLDHELKADRKEAMIQEMEKLADQGRFGEAKEAAQRLLRHYPNDYRAVAQAANIYYRSFSPALDKGDMVRAIELTKRLFALAEDPAGMKRFELMSRLGNQYENIDDYETARKYYTDSNVAGLNDRELARLLGKEGRNREAAEAVTKVFSSTLCNLFTDIMMLQQVWRELGELEKARAALEWGIGALGTVGGGLGKTYAPLGVVMYLQLAGLARESGDEARREEYGQKAVALAGGGNISTAPDFLTDNVTELSVSPELRSPEGVQKFLDQLGDEMPVTLGKAKE